MREVMEILDNIPSISDKSLKGCSLFPEILKEYTDIFFELSIINSIFASKGTKWNSATQICQEGSMTISTLCNSYYPDKNDLTSL